jgi:hypothetical protein
MGIVKSMTEAVVPRGGSRSKEIGRDVRTAIVFVIAMHLSCIAYADTVEGCPTVAEQPLTIKGAATYVYKTVGPISLRLHIFNPAPPRPVGQAGCGRLLFWRRLVVGYRRAIRASSETPRESGDGGGCGRLSSALSPQFNAI